MNLSCANHKGFRTGRMQDREDAGQEGFRIGDAGQVGWRKVGFRTGGMQDKWDSG